MSSDSCLLIRHARILLPNGDFLIGDVQTRDRQIIQVAAEIPAAGDADVKEIDATGLTLLPGVIDPQVHFANQGWNTKRIYSRLAVLALKVGLLPS